MVTPTPKLDVERILNNSSVPSSPHTFYLGSRSARVTIVAQQTRAFNLLWALEKKFGVKGKSIAVIGAGFAGLSASAASLLLGAEVYLFDAYRRPLYFQAGNNSRFLHPGIADWPLPKANIQKTKLPFLNWTAAYSNTVCADVMKQWALIDKHPRFHPYYEYTVDKVRVVNDRPYVNANGKSTFSRNFDFVVSAVGFGAEITPSHFTTPSYWHNDSLHQFNSGHHHLKRILVTGCGDGGLIDVLRLRIADFRHDILLGWLNQTTDVLTRARTKLITIEQEARKLSADASSLYLFEEYANLVDSVEAASILHEAVLRPDTSVVLNGTSPTALSLKASIANRFAVFLLMRIENGGLAYRSTSMKLDELKLSNSTVWVPSLSSAIRREEFDEVVVRHGPQGVLGQIFDQEIPEPDPATDILVGSVRRWPAKFYPNPSLIAERHGLIRYSFDSRYDRMSLLHEAVKLRLQASPLAEDKLLEITRGDSEHFGIAEFELALLYMSRGQFAQAIILANRAAGHLPRPLAWISLGITKFIRLREDDTNSQEAQWWRSSPNRILHNFASYTALQRGWVHLREGNSKVANATWSLTNQNVSSDDILLGYPFIHQTLILDQLFIDILCNPEFKDEERLRKFILNRFVSAVDRSGFVGHQNLLAATAGIVSGSAAALQNFTKMARRWRSPNRVAGEQVKFRLEVFRSTVC